MTRGVNIDKVEQEAFEEETQPMLFRDPADYEEMSEEEREELTKKMMGYHRGWVETLKEKRRPKV